MSGPAISNPRCATGGSFLIVDLGPEDIFTLEDLSDEQRQIERATVEFAEKEIQPRIAAIEAKDFGVTKDLLRKAGELGLMGVDVPEEHGGLQMDKVTSALIAEKIAICGSFSVSFSAHVGIGTLPLVWYGTAEQKKKYLSRLASGEWIAAYALSEASSGSDAMNLRTRAKLSADGKHYVLNGEKMWISNAGIAHPMMTSSICFTSSSGKRSKAPRTAIAPRSSGRVDRRAPFGAFPTAVRIALTMNAFFMLVPFSIPQRLAGF